MSRTERPARRLGRSGSAVVEFAVLVPILGLLGFGVLDLVMQMRAYYRVERMAGELLNAIAQLDPVKRSDIVAILNAAGSIGGSGIAIGNTSGNDGAITVTALTRSTTNSNANAPLWSLTNYASGNPPGPVATRIGGSTPRLPGGVLVPSGAQFIAVEVASQRVPWLPLTYLLLRWWDRPRPAAGAVPPAQVLYAIAVARPRTANLTGTLPP
ncbi:MAG TPA: TadE/TadG family type IV pilus assembly protein [Roseomonas sp.]|jgi:Flp pilus assembly protein TadG